MITKKHIKNANYDHELNIMGKECKGATITISGKKILISVDKKTNELVHAELINPEKIKTDWSVFTK